MHISFNSLKSFNPAFCMCMPCSFLHNSRVIVLNVLIFRNLLSGIPQPFLLSPLRLLGQQGPQAPPLHQEFHSIQCQILFEVINWISKLHVFSTKLSNFLFHAIYLHGIVWDICYSLLVHFCKVWFLYFFFFPSRNELI